MTAVDLSKNWATVQFFETPKEAESFCHGCSKEQAPEWHRLHCERCLGEKAKPTSPGCACWWCQTFFAKRWPPKDDFKPNPEMTKVILPPGEVGRCECAVCRELR